MTKLKRPFLDGEVNLKRLKPPNYVTESEIAEIKRNAVEAFRFAVRRDPDGCTETDEVYSERAWDIIVSMALHAGHPLACRYVDQICDSCRED